MEYKHTGHSSNHKTKNSWRPTYPKRGSRGNSRATFKTKSVSSASRRSSSWSSRHIEAKRSRYQSSQSVRSTQTRDEEFSPEELLEREKMVWTRSSPAELYYQLGESNSKVVYGSQTLQYNLSKFNDAILMKAQGIRANHPKYASLPRKPKIIWKKHGGCHARSSSSSSSDSSDYESDYEDHTKEELDHKIKHPLRLHPELWFNDCGEMNDGPLCRCSAKSRRFGIRHNIYAGEGHLPPCDPNSNNADRLYHYRITISPHTNFVIPTPTIIEHDNHEYIFEGFSMFSHKKLEELPSCKVIRFNFEYTILYYEEKFPQNMTIKELNSFSDYLFKEILEMVDLDFKADDDTDGCPQFHFMPRFVRKLPGNGKEILSMHEVIKYLLKSYKPLVRKEDLKYIMAMPPLEWQINTEKVKGMIVTYPGKKPASLRVDQLDRDQEENLTLLESDTNSRTSYSQSTNSSEPSTSKQSRACKYSGEVKSWSRCSKLPVSSRSSDKSSCSTNPRSQSPVSSMAASSSRNSEEPNRSSELSYPKIVHFGIRPPQLSYAGNTEYQKAWREYVKFRHLMANMSKPTNEDKRKLENKEARLQNMRIKSELKRNVTVTVSSENFYKTGIMCDVVQHAMMIPVLVSHLRFHCSLDVLEKRLDYKFKNKYLLQLALTHPSYRENFGTNPDHARNSLSNCGIRQPTYGDRKIHIKNNRKRGINTLIDIMSRLGKTKETESNITHNERLEFLGDAVVEFVVSIHLFLLFSSLEEGGLATYRAAIVQNQHLAKMAATLVLQEFMQYAHGSDLCHELEQKHAMANCFEALMGALFLDGGIEVADKVFGNTFYKSNEDCKAEWFNTPLHPLQIQEPQGDRHMVPNFEFLQKLTKFEDMTGLHFTHIRLLARAFTDRSVGFTHLTLGSNQRLEFLGDTVLQLIASDFLYKHFPEHHEGHLSLLRSSLVNNRTQAVVCDDLGMTEFALYANPKAELKTKDRADLLEALLGAMYIDQGLGQCQVFCEVCFFPRLKPFILNQEWNDPKSKLQQCCLTLRTMEGGEPEIPLYKVVNTRGPTNTRVYEVAVYFRGERLACASGGSIQTAQMNAAKAALNSCGDLFPQLKHQRRVIAKSTNSPSEEQTDANNKPKKKRKRKAPNSTKIELKQETMSSEGALPGRVKTLPLAYQTCNSPETSKEHVTKPIIDNPEKPGKYEVSQNITKEFIKNKTIKENATYDLKHLSKGNDRQKRLPESDISNNCRETLSPARSSESRFRDQHRDHREYTGERSCEYRDNRYPSNHKRCSESKPHGDYFESKYNKSYSQSTSSRRSLNRKSYREQTPTKSLGRLRKYKSPEDSYKEGTPRRLRRGKSPEDSYKEGTPRRLRRSKSPDDSYRERIPRRLRRSKSPDDSYRERIPRKLRRSKSPDDSYTERIPRKLRRSKSPDNSCRERIPRRQRRSKSPEDIKQTFMNILYGDKNTSYHKKETASSSLIDMVFNKRHKSQQSEFGIASYRSQPYSLSNPYPELGQPSQVMIKTEKQEDNFAQGIVQNDLYGPIQIESLHPVCIKEEPQDQGGPEQPYYFNPSPQFGMNYNYEYENFRSHNYNMQ